MPSHINFKRSVSALALCAAFSALSIPTLALHTAYADDLPNVLIGNGSDGDSANCI